MSRARDLAAGTFTEPLDVSVDDFEGISITNTVANKDPLLKLVSQSTNNWQVQLDASQGDSLQLRYNNSENIRFLPAGGITFNGDTAAANALDDYEEGTFTPALTFGGGSTGMSYSAQAGYYTKIGNIVYCTVYIALSAKGSSTGNADIGGLPFTSNSTGGANASVQAGSMSINEVSFADFPMVVLVNNSTSLSLREITNAGTFSYLNDTNFINISNMVFTITYRV